MKKFFFLFLFIFAISLSTAIAEQQAVIYKNEACGHCGFYLKDLRAFFESRNINYTEMSIVNDFNARRELDNATKEFDIPPEMQGHMAVRIGNLMLEGHIPISIIEEQFQKYPDFDFPKTVIYQDSMAEVIENYKILQDGDIKEYNIKTGEYTLIKSRNFWEKSVPLLVLFGGLFAGIHPCTISVLLFFIAFLFTIRSSKRNIFKVGAAYIGGVFAAYFLIGLGVLNAISVSNQPHFFAKVASIVIVALGIFNIIKYFSRGKIRFSLGIPKSMKPKIVELVHKSTIPAALVLGLLVGMCSFGCTAGIYLSVISLLLAKATYLAGFAYLLLYNIMFILPLIIILMVTTNKRTLHKIENLEAKDQRYFKLISGIIMIVLGIVIWVIA